MNDFRPDHQPYQAPPRRFLSLVLTAAVHIGLAVFLFYGISWQSKSLDTLEVGLASAPSPSIPPPAPEPPKESPPPPKPEVPPPEPPKEPPPQPKPEIATKKPVKPKPEPPKPEKKPEPKKPERKPPEPPLKPIDFQKQLDQKLDRDIARTAEAKKVDAILGGGQKGQSSKPVGDPAGLSAYQAAIHDKVKRNLVFSGLSGNPEAVFEIEQVMGSKGGEVISVKLIQSSGNHTLDEAIERAIRKSDPLPLPDNPDLFKRKLNVTFRPNEK